MIRMTAQSGACQAAQGDRRAKQRIGQASSPHELVAGKPANQPLQLQDAERGQDLRSSQAGAGDQLVDAGGMVVELAEQGSFLVAEAKLGRGARRNGTTGALAGAALAGYTLIIWWSSVAARRY